MIRACSESYEIRNKKKVYFIDGVELAIKFSNILAH